MMKEISPAKLKTEIHVGTSILLIDVRENFEREVYNIGGAHIPLGELMQRTGEIDREKPTVLYCEKGIRSAIAIQRLELMGFTNLINLEGGMKAWKEVND